MVEAKNVVASNLISTGPRRKLLSVNLVTLFK